MGELAGGGKKKVCIILIIHLQVPVLLSLMPMRGRGWPKSRLLRKVNEFISRLNNKHYSVSTKLRMLNWTTDQNQDLAILQFAQLCLLFLSQQGKPINVHLIQYTNDIIINIRQSLFCFACFFLYVISIAAQSITVIWASKVELIRVNTLRRRNYQEICKGYLLKSALIMSRYFYDGFSYSVRVHSISNEREVCEQSCYGVFRCQIMQF